MSKHKKKFRAEVYQKLLSQTAPQEKPEIKPEDKTEAGRVVFKTEPTNNTTVAAVKDSSPVVLEVKKIMLVMSLLAALLIVFYILEIKTPLLHNFGDLLLKFFRVS
ncbi:hypothetical protein HY373_01785 [Candidatus Berkelbacteria bacterium]|nr:hypothetical protein [Candidatus Berkelbacteria bacterium]MBI4029890.1 hypothetical protein [Candidatus Berkelbacteria bacterium]